MHNFYKMLANLCKADSEAYTKEAKNKKGRSIYEKEY